MLSWIVRIMVAGILILWPVAAYADDVSPHRVHIKTVGLDFYPVAVDEIGCAWFDYADDYHSEPECTNCNEALCTFGSTFEMMSPKEGGYIVASNVLTVTLEPTSALSGTITTHNYGMWYTNEYGEGYDWEEIHVMIVVVDESAATPTPVPTYTPFPTPTPPSTPDISAGFDAGFDETSGTLSGAGVTPSFGIDVNTWLFYARKVIAMINQGNLLYVVAGILMAGLVLGWAIEQVKNPR